MEVRIRLQKSGKLIRGYSNYRIVAISGTTSRDGKHLEILGHYDPSKKPAMYSLDLEKIEKWVAKGAILSDTVKSLVSKTRKQK
jgi:small subunit ribosomal protein S16